MQEQGCVRANMEIEFKRNQARYQFLKWGMQAFKTFKVVPPGIGIVHQVNLEYLAKGVLEKDGVYYPDTLVGTDSHTTMINGLGIVGWGVGGIEAEAGMLGQPVYFLTPDVVGVHLTGQLREGVTATDLVLHLPRCCGKPMSSESSSSIHGEGAAHLPLTDRATIANMAPEYGATMGFFPVDEETCKYLEPPDARTNTSKLSAITSRRKGCSASRGKASVDYSQVLELNLADVQPSVAGPKRPQDRIELAELERASSLELFRSRSTKMATTNQQENCRQRFPSRSACGQTGRCGSLAAEPGAGNSPDWRDMT